MSRQRTSRVFSFVKVSIGFSGLYFLAVTMLKVPALFNQLSLEMGWF